MNILRFPAYRAVQRGAALLDRVGPPDWEDLVDLDTLNIRDGNSCVAGQVFRPAANRDLRYINGFAYVAHSISELGTLRRNSRHGFDTRVVPGGGYCSLRAEWRKEVLRRRAAKIAKINENLLPTTLLINNREEDLISVG